MPRIQFTTITGQVVIDPDESQLRHELFEVPWQTWYPGMHESAMLEVVLNEDEQTAVKASTLEQPPMLIVVQPNADEFLICWLQDGEEWNPYNGEPCDACSTYYSGGDEYRTPDACLVDPETALRIMRTFITSQTCDTVVDWIRRDDLPVDNSFWEPI